MAEMREVVAASPELAGKAEKRASAALGRLGTTGKGLNVAEARALFSAMIAA
jgi:hypothetical protein